MRKLANNVPTAALHPNAPPMSQAAPVKAMPAPAPPGFTTPPPMNQAKMGEEEDGSRVPRGVVGGSLGALAALAATTPGVFLAHKRISPDAGFPEHIALRALERKAFHKALGRAAGATLLSAALGVGLERLARGMTPTAQKVHDVKSQAEKTAFNRSTVLRRKLGPHEFHVEYPEGMSVGGVQSKYDYGYLPGVRGPDGDSLDFYLGHDPKGSIARFTKKLPGVEGVADHKYFAGFTPEQLADYQAKFPEYTKQPGAALTDRVDFKDWDDLNRHLAALPKTGPLTRLQEAWASRAPIKTASHFGFNKQASMRDILDKALAAKNKYVANPIFNFGAGALGGAVAPIDTFRHLPDLIRDTTSYLPDRIAYGAGTLAGAGTLGYGAYRGGKALYNMLRPEPPTQDVHVVNTPK